MSVLFGTYLVALALLGLGAVFIVGWIKAYRFRHPYVGFLGMALIIFGVRRAFEFAPVVESALQGIALLLLCWTAILMASHSYANYRRVWSEYEKDRARRAAVLIAEVEELSRRAQKRGVAQGEPDTEADASHESTSDHQHNH